MPLPAALLAKLKQRGIVEAKKKLEEEEEVFAENYDESDESESSDEEGDSETEETTTETPLPKPLKDTKELRESVYEAASHKTLECPNSINPFHECTSYCRKKYGAKRFEPHPIMEKRRLRMLKIYPLLPNWKEVADLNTDRYYYWNTETDQVCWLSPSHPKAKYVTISEQNPSNKVVQVEVVPRIVSQMYSSHEDAREVSPEPVGRRHEVRDEGRHHHDSSGHRSNKSSSVPYYKRGKKNEGENDPMDPSSYSDTKKGKWSAGMENPSVKVGSSIDEE